MPSGVIESMRDSGMKGLLSMPSEHEGNVSRSVLVGCVHPSRHVEGNVSPVDVNGSLVSAVVGVGGVVAVGLPGAVVGVSGVVAVGVDVVVGREPASPPAVQAASPIARSEQTPISLMVIPA